MRLIDVCVLKEWIENWFTKNRFYHPYAKNNNIPITELYDILEQMPSAQPEIIRCKDCKYNYGLAHGGEFNPHDIVCSFFDTDGMQYCDFCSYAERIHDEDDDNEIHNCGEDRVEYGNRSMERYNRV